MKQVIIKKGIATTEEVSSPVIEGGFVLIKTAYSCISAGTEISNINNTKKSLLNRAIEKPEKINQAIQIIKKQGFINATKQIYNLTSTGQSSGYSLSGIVVDIGTNVESLKKGDKVAAAGGGYAVHAEYVLVPKNLVVKIPDNVSLKDASTATIGAIALHGVRRASLTIGEYATVIGCGVIGLFTIQLLKASGVKVVAIDPDNRRLRLAKELKADYIINSNQDKIIETVKQWTNGMGVDAVLFTASVKTAEPLSQAFKICRKKGRVVLIGTTPIEINRQDIYNNEIDFLISTSYGPGRYDKLYEEEGNDYPYAYVRWTEQRNIAEFLNLIATNSVKVSLLIEKILKVDEADKAFKLLTATVNKPLIVLLKYENKKIGEDNKVVYNTKPVVANKKINIAIIGVGSFFKNVHLPNILLLKNKFHIYAVMSRKGYDAKIIADQNGAKYSTTEYSKIINDKEVDLIFISTRHKSHGNLVIQALKAGKNVFVEKPLTTNINELNEIEYFFKNTKAPPMLMVGYNRRFSKISNEIKKAVSTRINPIFLRYRMNAGYLQQDHWIFSEGGRIIGEACHIIDFAQFIIGQPIEEMYSLDVTPKTNYYSSTDNKTISLKFKDGSLALIDYFSSGNNKLPKEFMELHFDGKSIVMEDFKNLTGYGVEIKNFKLKTSDKGHIEELIALHGCLTEKTQSIPIEIDSLIQTSKITFLA